VPKQIKEITFMGIVKGLDAINKAVENSTRDFGEDTPKAKWLKLKDGQSVKINFLQEFDENSKNYSPKNGTVIMAKEHPKPSDFTVKCLCTADDGGECLPCELHKQNPEAKWGVKSRLYANVLVDDGTNEPYVAILSQGLGDRSITPTLVEASKIYGSITKNAFRMKRHGANFSNTSYSLIPFPEESSVDVDAYELYDLEAVCTRDVPYEDQSKFFGLEDDASESSGDVGLDTEW
jgi:hypothetical protein